MPYCKRCREVFDEDVCPFCGCEYPIKDGDYPDRDEMDIDIPPDAPKKEE